MSLGENQMFASHRNRLSEAQFGIAVLRFLSGNLGSFGNWSRDRLIGTGLRRTWLTDRSGCRWLLGKPEYDV